MSPDNCVFVAPCLLAERDESPAAGLQRFAKIQRVVRLINPCASEEVDYCVLGNSAEIRRRQIL